MSAPIPVLPERVCWREYPSDQLLCGLTEKTVQPCYVPLTQTQFLLLSYTPGTETSVRAIIAQAEKKLSPAEQICFDDDDPQSAVEFDRQIAALMPMLQQRKDADSDHPQWPWILICVNNLRRCIDSIDRSDPASSCQRYLFGKEAWRCFDCGGRCGRYYKVVERWRALDQWNLSNSLRFCSARARRHICSFVQIFPTAWLHRITVRRWVI